MNSKKASTGGFRLVLTVGSVCVPAHPGSLTRAKARALKAMYKQHRPNVKAHVVKI